MHKNERIAEPNPEAGFQAQIMTDKVSKLRSKVVPGTTLGRKYISNCCIIRKK
jgi:hypothetical protein